MRVTIIAAAVIVVLGVVGGLIAGLVLRPNPTQVAAPTPGQETAGAGDQREVAETAVRKATEMVGSGLTVSLTFDRPGGAQCDAVTRAMEVEIGRHPEAWQRLTVAVTQDEGPGSLGAEVQMLDTYSRRGRCVEFAAQAGKVMALLDLPAIGQRSRAAEASPAAKRSTPKKEEILAFESDIEISNDGSLSVTETIRIVVLDKVFQTGFYRQLPGSFWDRNRKVVRLFFDVQEVLRNGEAMDYSLRSFDNVSRIFVGKDGDFLKPGEYTFTFRYTANNQVGAFDDRDELYWPVTGNWSLPVRAVRVTIKAPGSSAPSAVEPYLNDVGADATTLMVEQLADDRTEIKTTRGLAANEGLTLAVSWPKGAILGGGPLAEPGRFRLEASGERSARFAAACTVNVNNRWHEISFEEPVPYDATLSVHGLYCEFAPRGGEVAIDISRKGTSVWRGKGSVGRLTAYLYPVAGQ